MPYEKVKHWVIASMMRYKEYKNPPKDVPYTEIPIIINNFNRLEYLLILLNGLEKRGYTNIHILDNQSDYPPLLDFYKTTKHKVHFLDKNYGFRALWKSGLYHEFKGNYFVYSDADLEIVDECPDNFLKFFRDTLENDKWCAKVGFSLKIDDLPDHYSLKQEVINWEKQYFKKPKGEFYKAPIDTTFALYRPYSFKHLRAHEAYILRAKPPYEVRHLPWYVDSNNLSDEEQYYIKTTQEISWAKKLEDDLSDSES